MGLLVGLVGGHLGDHQLLEDEEDILQGDHHVLLGVLHVGILEEAHHHLEA